MPEMPSSSFLKMLLIFAAYYESKITVEAVKERPESKQARPWLVYKHVGR